MCYLAQGLSSLGHGSTILCPEDSPCFARATELGLDVRPFSTGGDLDLLAARRVAKIADDLDSDIVHAHTSKTLFPAAACKRFTSRPLHAVAHRRVDFSIHKLPFRLSGLKYRWGVDRFIAITEAVKRVMIADGIPEDRIRVVHSSTDISRFDHVERNPDLRRELGIPEEAKLVGNVAALVGHKGQRHLLDAIPAVLDTLPDTFFLVLGEGPLRGELEDRAQRLKITHNLRMPGFRSDVPQCLAEMDLFCMPSSGEGMGSVLLEAMAMRLPVAATRAGGIPEVVQPEKTGLLVTPGDAPALAEALIRLLSDDDLATGMGYAGRRRVEEAFTTDRMVERTLQVYEELRGIPAER